MMDKKIKIMLIAMLICGLILQLSYAYDSAEYERLSNLYGQVYCESTYGIARAYGARDILTPPAYQRVRR